MQNVARELAAEEYDHVAFFQNSLGSAATPVKTTAAEHCANSVWPCLVADGLMGATHEAGWRRGRSTRKTDRAPLSCFGCG